MKQFYFMLVLFLGLATGMQAQNTVEVDPSATWIGYMNVFETPGNGGGFVFGQGWGVPDLKSVIDPGAGTVTLQPNFNVWNPADPFWVDAGTGLGNKTMEANTYVEDNSLVGSALTFEGGVSDFTIDPGYTVFAFIKVFNADFSILKIETVELTGTGNFSVEYTNVEGTDAVVQYGFQVIGLCADPANEGALGSVVVTPPASNATLIEFDAAAPWIGYMNVFETPGNGGGFVFGQGWGVPDLKTVVDAAGGTVTLQPNFNVWNPADPFWVDAGTGLGNKTMEANTFVEDNSLVGQELTWTGNVSDFTIDPGYTVFAFIKVFNADFSILKIETMELTGTGAFTVDYTNVEGTDAVVQYGFQVIGLCADPANEGALGSVVIGDSMPPPSLSFPIDFEAGQMPIFGDFNGSATQIIANPDPSGSNTSATVAENTVPGGAAFAGVNFPINYDIITDKYFRMQVWSPIPDTPVLLKLENSGTGVNTELVATTTTVGAWEELVWDFSFEPGLTFDSVTIFMNFNVVDPGTQTYYWDGLEQFTPGGGGAFPCNQDNPLSGVAGGGLGSSVDSDFKTAADITVPAGENFTIETINTYFLTFAPNDPPTTATIIYREDDGGLPGAQIGTETVVPTVLNAQPWANPVADQYETTMDVTPFTFVGDAGSDTKYWIEVSMGTATNQATVFWEYTNDVPVVGEPAAQFDASAGTWSIPDPTQEVVYDFIGSCEVVGGGGGSPCDQENPLSGVAGGGLGSSVDSDFKTAADITVAAGENFTIENIDTYFLTFAPNDPPTTATIIYREDDGGLPGAQIGTETVVPTVLNAQPWANPVADQYETTMAVTPFTFNGDAGSDTKYWIEISMGTATNQATVFWEYTNDVPVVGEPAAQFDGGAGTWSIPDPTQEVVYNFSGTCDPIGGGGPTCTSTTFDSADVPVELDGAGTSTADCANAPNLAGVTIANGGGTIGSGAILENVVIDITHTWSGDLTIWLRAPSGTELLLAEELSGNTDDAYNGTTFEDGGADITAAAAPFGVGPYEPQGGTFAAAFDGEDIDGDWFLVVCDGAGGDTGFINQFTLNMCLPPSPDVCEGAAVVECGDVIVGTTTDNTDTGGNPAPDEWYQYTGSGDPEIVTVSLCDGGTTYDSYLRVFDACGGTEIAFNDDFCGLQSEVSFLSDGTSTYYIMIEGFASEAGDFSMAISCVPIAENDECDNALPIACGDVINGSTSNSTFDNAPECVTTNTAPGVWYVYEDTSGLVTDILLSTCSENTDYDTKVSVYSGDCGELICVNGNDDSPNCSAFQTEVEFQSDGNSTYYILVHGFGSATGNFELSMSCVCVPMSNDDIANSNDADEVGFPYTDPGVQGPCATTEDDTPVDCDNAGVQGFWYNFTPEMDGLATCEVISPAGFTSVTFYDAPSESATESELTLIDYFDNQCVPQNDASVPVIAGQAYYVYVANTGGITDVVIDGTFFLGANDNQIEGFTFAPNPAENVVTLSSVEVIEQVQLFNVLGQKVIDLQTNALTQSVDVSTLAVGTYLMQVTVNGQKGTYKVVKK